VLGNVVQVQPYVRRHDRWTNCYISNIPTDWDEDRLQQEFAQFGEIVSAKGVYKPWNPDDDDDDEDEEYNGESSHRLPLRRGFLRFAAHEHAVAAVEALNGKEYKTTVGDENGATEMMQKLYVKRGLKKMERVRERTRVYVRNLHGAVTDAMLREEFGPFGTITSARVTKDIVDGRSLGSGFVTFASFQEASRAVKERNGKLVHGKPITLSLERKSIDSNVQQDDNIYVKNLDGAVTDDILRDIFSTIGSVTSAVVLKEATNGRSRGVGFVSFSTSAEAAQAIHKMNGTMIHGKKIAVTFAVRRRDVRSA
jgi:RNA recognition motif-containing protein